MGTYLLNYKGTRRRLAGPLSRKNPIFLKNRIFQQKGEQSPMTYWPTNVREKIRFFQRIFQAFIIYVPVQEFSTLMDQK
jgi:hypothetical protein